MTGIDIGNKSKIHQLVEVFYPQPFKTFYINSEDGKSLCQPVGVFVSLGITTSLKVLNNIINAINGSKEFKASLVEIGSKRDEGIFLNYIKERNPDQYRIADVPGLLSREEVLKEMEDLGDSVVDASLEETQRIGATVTRLKVLFQKLEDTGGWNDHCIQKTDIGYRIYHLNVNYVRIGDIEYRIGILVNEKD